jgi:hypothetical protein
MSSEALRDEHDDTGSAPTEEAADTTEAGDALGPPTAFESLVAALLEAGPDVAEHVVKAAQELLLAVQVVVDAADKAVQEQRNVRDARTGASQDAATDDSVRHLDLAE